MDMALGTASVRGHSGLGCRASGGGLREPLGQTGAYGVVATQIQNRDRHDESGPGHSPLPLKRDSGRARDGPFVDASLRIGRDSAGTCHRANIPVIRVPRFVSVHTDRLAKPIECIDG